MRVVVAASALVALAPATALAGDESTSLGTEGGLDYRVSVSEDFVGSGLNSFVGCEDGARPISGGIDLEGSPTGSRMAGTYPAKEVTRIWRSGGRNLVGGPMDLRFFGICREAQPAVSRFRSASRSIDPNTPRGVKVACPKGFRATGGGYQTGNSSVALATVPYDGKDADKQADDGWRARAFNSSVAPEELTAFVSCRKTESWDLEYVREEVTVGGGSSVESTDLCDQGVVTGGGASISGSSDVRRIHESYPADGADLNATPADGWTTSLRNSDVGDAAAVFFAICKS
jgi:hypothetical protein